MPDQSVLVAHGFAARQDLPIPFSYALTAAGLALIISFAGLALLWNKPRFENHDGGWALPSGLAGFLDSTGFRWFVRVVGLVGTGFVASAAIIGPDDALNPTAGAVYVLFWVAILVVASVVLGPVWRALNPLRTIHLLLAAAMRTDPGQGVFEYPRRLGAWPATIALLSFGWLELVAPDRATTGVLLTYFALYSGVMLVGASLFGSTWFDHADGFERYSTTVGRLSPLGRRAGDRAPVLRNPLTNLTTMPQTVGQPAFVAAMLAITAFDSLSSTPDWFRFAQERSYDLVAMGTVGIVLTFLLVLGVYCLAAGLTGVFGEQRWRRMPAAFAHSIVPIAVGYVVAHYYSYVVVGLQQNLQQFSDPYGTGADYLGIAENTISYTLVTPTAVAIIQVAAVVTGHVLGVFAAHDRAMALFRRRHGLAGQVPMLLVMVVFTVGGISLLFAG